MYMSAILSNLKTNGDRIKCNRRKSCIYLDIRLDTYIPDDVIICHVRHCIMFFIVYCVCLRLNPYILSSFGQKAIIFAYRSTVHLHCVRMIKKR